MSLMLRMRPKGLRSSTRPVMREITCRPPQSSLRGHLSQPSGMAQGQRQRVVHVVVAVVRENAQAATNHLPYLRLAGAPVAGQRPADGRRFVIHYLEAVAAGSQTD